MKCTNSEDPNRNECADMQIDGTTLVRYAGQDALATVPDGVEKLGEWAFSDTQESIKRFQQFRYAEVPRTLEAVCLPPSLKVIGKGAFHREPLLKEILFSEGLEEIEEHAFAYCKSLSEVMLPDTIRSISNSVFAGCEALKRVIIPHAVEGDVARKATSHSCIPAEMFYQCWQLEEAAIPHGTIVIGERAFKNCHSLSEVVIPDTVEEIMDNAFDGCIAFQTLAIPARVRWIGNEAIPHGAQSKLNEIQVSPDNQMYCSMAGVLYTKDMKTLIACPAMYKASVFSVPDSVEEIAPSAFEGCRNIRKIVVPKSVHRIGAKAFARMYNLREVTFLAQLEKIETEVFSYCTKLNKVNWPKGLQSIGYGAFEYTAFTEILIPEGVKSIGDHAFAARVADETIYFADTHSKPKLREKAQLPKSLETIGVSAFDGAKSIEGFDTIEPTAKLAESFVDEINGHPNGKLGLAGVWQWPGYSVCACNSDWHDHVITVRSAEDGAIKYRVRMPEKQKRKVYCTFASSWGRNGEFNFKAIDRIFDELTPDAKLSYAMDRLLCQQNISEEFLDQLIEFLKKRAKRAITRVLEGDSLLDLACLARHGIMKKSSASSYIKQAVDLKAAQCEEWLVKWQSEET